MQNRIHTPPLSSFAHLLMLIDAATELGLGGGAVLYGLATSFPEPNATLPTSEAQDKARDPGVLTLRKEDARFIGLHGDWVGDVIYGISGDFGAKHAPQVPTAQYGIGDLRGLFALSGPNIRQEWYWSALYGFRIWCRLSATLPAGPFPGKQREQ